MTTVRFIPGAPSLDAFNPNKNPAFFINWMFVILGLAIMWKYRSSPGFWMGVFALIIIGIRMTVGPGTVQPNGTVAGEYDTAVKPV